MGRRSAAIRGHAVGFADRAAQENSVKGVGEGSADKRTSDHGDQEWALKAIGKNAEFVTASGEATKWLSFSTVARSGRLRATVPLFKEARFHK
jgi:hypothetical protein